MEAVPTSPWGNVFGLDVMNFFFIFSFLTYFEKIQKLLENNLNISWI